jgi:predicted permease
MMRARETMRDSFDDVRYALRSWVRQPGFALVAILSLACGIGLNTAVFSIINTIFLQGIRGVPAADRVVSVGGRVPFSTFRDVRETAVSLEGAAVWQPVSADLRIGDLVIRTHVPAVSANYFTALGVRPAVGRFFTGAASRIPEPIAEVVLDHDFWVRTLGRNSAVVGTQILVNRVPVTVIGVAPDEFHGFGPERSALWVPMGLLPALRGTPARWDDPNEGGWRIVGRLPAGVSVGQLNAELRTLAVRSPSSFPGGALVASTGPESWNGPVSDEKRIEFLLVVVLPLVVVGLILWVGCSNVANLLLARAAARRREIAIRIASGASRLRLVRLLLTEGLLLALAGGAVGLLLAEWTLDAIWLTLPDAPRLAIDLDAHVLLYTGAVCVAATLLFALVPALHATRVDVAPLLKDEGPLAGAVRGTHLRRFFLLTQFASSLALLVVAGTFVRTLVAAHTGEVSRLIDQIVVAHVDAGTSAGAVRSDYWRQVRDRLRQVPGVVSVTVTLPASWTRTTVTLEHGAETASPAQADIQSVDSEFFTTAGTPVVTGQLDRTGPASAVAINERAARQFWPTASALNQRFAIANGGQLHVGAIVRDDGLQPRVFVPLRDEEVAAGNVMVRTSAPATAMLDAVRSVLSSIAGDRTFVRVTTLREANMGSLSRMSRLAMVIAGLTLALASIGLYGSIAFVTEQRSREIAIRVAVGAPAAAVVRLIAREGVLVVCAGFVAGLALVGTVFRFMSGMIFAQWTLDPVVIAGVLTVFAATTAAACYRPARRAIKVDPIRTLRAD